ncbi:endonuclease/exonuclease/phosphatase family protein [Polymorphospora sp. NPDC051019]|uniref:endonuclease/exonuclease/phosphatase family protein n=1 Tax=Polymorphospora sp. NPDC051019 TaxID=3155725 RepID=UPI00344465C1
MSVAATALGIALLVDVLRVWLPSIITIFGQAAATPAELMGAFALMWFVLALGAPPLVRRVGPRPVLLAAAIVLGGCRAGLGATDGGQVQLYVASFGLLAGLVWLAATAAGTADPTPGLVLGLAAGTVLHTALDTLDLTWRTDPLSWVLTGAMVAAFLALSWRAESAPGPVRAAPWLLVGPALLLSGMIAGSPALATTAVSYLYGGAAGTAGSNPLGDTWPGVVTAAAVALFAGAGLARPPRGPMRWLAPVPLLAGTVMFVVPPTTLLIPAILLTAVGLGACLAQAAPAAPVVPAAPAAPQAPAAPEAAAATGSAAAATTRGPAGVPGSGRPGMRAGFAVVGGMVVFAVGAVLYYSAYDLGYPNQWVPVVLALFVAAVVMRRPVRRPGSAVRRPLLVTVAAAVATLLAAVAVPNNAVQVREPEPGPVRVVAYNVRMGFGLDGRFDLAGLVDVVAGQRADVVALSEVDRAWLLNGGHDTLALIADRLGMRYVFAPAADAVWGDAILTRLPVTETRTVRLTPVGAPTGAQALAAVLDTGIGELVVVSTHLQPPPDDGPVVQAGEVVRFATGYAAGRPLVVAGDFNTEPGDPAFQVFTDAGLVDALAPARPLPTAPADAPDEQIDHIFVSAGLTATDAAAPPSTASDHLAVAVTLDRART